ncbi:hypothetical protein [Bradyrhizobium oropedii]|uniref:hypothetical protein n=1 Tax=Bradyrhizobium oropedii TaxID=1571201 RepID=UPI001E4D4E0C|nr:hypothetical protein [Bradyrhizobium oropedii]
MTQHISRKLVQNIFRSFDYAKVRSFDYAKVMGVPFNIYVVAHLHESTAKSAATIFQLLRDKYRDWLSYRTKKLGLKLPPMYVFAFEAPGNVHVNWVLYVPPELLPDFRKKLPRWLAKAQGTLGNFDLEVTDIDPAGAYKGMANYLVKGCDPAFIEHSIYASCSTSTARKAQSGESGPAYARPSTKQRGQPPATMRSGGA